MNEAYRYNEAMNKILQLPSWESMMKRIIWKQLGDIRGKKILDFGSGIGKNACYLAKYNEVIAIEPDKKSVADRWTDYSYVQLTGSTEQLQAFASESFDIILCHNVFEYAPDRDVILREFSRLIKKDGWISILKHNRLGRVMQAVTLLNDFDYANNLLVGGDSYSEQYGVIHYYEDQDLLTWCDDLEIVKTLGMRTFWHMQQKQENHGDREWQEQMIEMDLRVADIEEFKQIAFFHHIYLRKTHEKE